jgi:bifunctional non-homologous end joining protein LigD
MSEDAQRIDLSVVPGARPAPFPGFIEPCRPALREEAPSGRRWIHETKFDGYGQHVDTKVREIGLLVRRLLAAQDTCVTRAGANPRAK